MTLVHRPSYARWGFPIEVADFTDGIRPAVRVGAHCRNCGWKGEARFRVGYKIPLWEQCPKCNCRELSAHDVFIARDEMTLEEEQESYKQFLHKMQESDEREREIRKAHYKRWAEADKKAGRL